jgi:hypothetical protein
MPKLSRRRNPDAPEECWHVYYSDVHVGTIAIREATDLDRYASQGLAVSILKLLKYGRAET